jgi:hypothetical protein
MRLVSDAVRKQRRLHWVFMLVMTSQLAACGADPSSTSGGEGGGAPIGPPTVGGLRIEEVFYAGSPGVVEHTWRDQFVDLVNDSDGIVDLRGLHIGNAFGAAGEINPGLEPSPFAVEGDYVYLENVFRVPAADGARTLAPGEHLLIAQSGTNHQPDSALDLSVADYETFIAGSARDDDWPGVPNLEIVHYTAGFDWLVPVFGGSLVVFRVEDPSELELVDHPDAGPVVRVPVSRVLDGIDALMDASSEAYKRLPTTVDASFAFVSDTYTGESLRRRRVEGVPRLVDTNDSRADLELVVVPEPGW